MKRFYKSVFNQLQWLPELLANWPEGDGFVRVRLTPLMKDIRQAEKRIRGDGFADTKIYSYLCTMEIQEIYDLFVAQINEYHKVDSVDVPLRNPYPADSFEALLYEKSFIDTVQWHLEDIIRPEDIDPKEALLLKRRIDASNQRRTDFVERIDDCFVAQFKDVQVRADAKLNTETPAWAIDRLSILALKIYHFAIEANREDADDAHKAKCQAKYQMLLTQRADLMTAIGTLLQELADGAKQMKVYRQMKMYNDPSLNPSLYKK